MRSAVPATERAEVRRARAGKRSMFRIPRVCREIPPLESYITEYTSVYGDDILKGWDPESYITEYILVYEENGEARNMCIEFWGL